MRYKSVADRDAPEWLSAIEAQREHERPWRDRARAVVARYRDALSGPSSSRINILYSNTDVLLSALYGRTPKPDVRRRFKSTEEDDAGRDAARILERALAYVQDATDFNERIRDSLMDYLLTGRGTLRVYYDPIVIEDDAGELIVDQKFCLKPVAWPDFVMGPGRIWGEVPWVAYIHYMTIDEVADMFGQEKADQLSYGFVPGGEDAQDRQDQKEAEAGDERARVFEIWCKRTRMRIWVTDGFEDFLDKEEDPYGLAEFYPSPAPLYSIRTTDTTMPVPEFCMYQDQVEELDLITTRMNRLLGALKRRGIYDGSIEGLADLKDADDNEFIPVENLSIEVSQKGGLDALFQQEPIDHLVRILGTLMQARQEIINTIYEVTGISEIMRGAAVDRETATTSRMKSQFGSLRLTNRKREVSRFVVGVLDLLGELIAEHAELDILEEMTQIPISRETELLLQVDRARGFRVDIESDESVMVDDMAEKQARVEALTAMGNFLTQIGPMVESGRLPFDAAKGMMMFGLAGFKHSREFEDLLDQLQPAPPQQGQAPDPAAQLAQVEAEKAQLEHKADMTKMQMQAQIDNLKAQLIVAQLDLDTKRQNDDFEIRKAGLELQAQKIDNDAQRDQNNFQVALERNDVQREQIAAQRSAMNG